MKTTKILGLALMASLSGMLAGCSDDVDYASIQGDGAIAVTTTLSTDVKVVSRSDANDLLDEYGESLILWITKPGSGPVRQYNGVDNLPVEKIVLPSGSYVAEAWAGDSVGASFDKKYFKAYVPFEVTKGNTAQLEVPLKLANSLVSVDYADDIEDYLKAWEMEVGHSRATITFEGYDSRKGYFMMPSTEGELTLTLRATLASGSSYEQTEVISNPQPATEYIVHVTANAEAPSIGGAMFNIAVDVNEDVIEETVVITLAPDIKLVNGDISEPVSAEEGNVGRKSIYVSAADELSSVVLISDVLTSLVGWNSLDFLTAASNYVEDLEAIGIVTAAYYSEETGLLTNLRINFEEEFTNSLAEGTYAFQFKAVDCDGRTSQAVFTLEVTNAPIVLAAASEITYTSAVLTADIVKADSSAEAAFYITDDSNPSRAGWTKVPAVVSGDKMTAELTGLNINTTYTYYAVYGSYETANMSFSTPDGWQMPNCDFEDWNTSSTPYLIYNTTEMWWDSGNHGSATMSKNVTVPSTTYKSSGSYSIQLQSQFVGVFGIGKFAAGNVFIGSYLETDGTDGVLGWGREFSFEYAPKGFSGYARYEQGTVDYANDGAGLSKGDDDQGIIYMALLSDDLSLQSDSSYPEWPVVVRTKTSKVFDPTASNVISYGQVVFDSNYGGSGMAKFSCTLNDVNPGQAVKYIVMVASASRYGDYFTGSTSSCLWLDDIHLDY